MFRFKKQIDDLPYEDRSVAKMFFGVERTPDASLVIQFLDSLRGADDQFKLPTNYVVRGRAHLEGWLTAFLRVENNELQKKFTATSGKSYETLILASDELSQIDIAFRLKTLGLEGYAEYRINIVKIDDDEYVCIE